MLSISDGAFTYYPREWLFLGKNNDRKMNELIGSNLGGKLSKKSRHNQCFFFCVSNSGGYWLLLCKSFNASVENCSLFIKQNQILQDAEFVNIALLAVLTVCGSALLQRDETSFVFNVCAAFGSTVGKSCQRVEKHFSSILKHLLNIVNVLTMD